MRFHKSLEELLVMDGVLHYRIPFLSCNQQQGPIKDSTVIENVMETSLSISVRRYMENYDKYTNCYIIIRNVANEMVEIESAL